MSAITFTKPDLFIHLFIYLWNSQTEHLFEWFFISTSHQCNAAICARTRLITKSVWMQFDVIYRTKLSKSNRHTNIETTHVQTLNLDDFNIRVRCCTFHTCSFTAILFLHLVHLRRSCQLFRSAPVFLEFVPQSAYPWMLKLQHQKHV